MLFAAILSSLTTLNELGYCESAYLVESQESLQLQKVKFFCN